MSFYPLPATFLTDLSRLSFGPVVELGSGDGRFTSILRDTGASVWTADRRPVLSEAEDLDVLADAAHPPFRGIRILVVANLLKHLWDDSAAERLLVPWIECLAPEGCLYIFEDQPMHSPARADIYRRVQDLLARIVPWRGRLLLREQFVKHTTSGRRGAGWTSGQQPNQFDPPDSSAVISLLLNARGTLSREVKDLAERVATEGIEYGDYWWARYERESV